MDHMYREILSAPDLLEGTVRQNLARVDALAARIRERSLSPVYVAARGSSANAGVYLAYLSEVFAGIPVHMLMPSVLTLYGGALPLEKGLCLAITQGGRGEDIRYLMEHAQSRGGLTAAICNEEDSPIARMADLLMPMGLGREQAMAATKTFTAELLLCGMLAFALAGKDPEHFARVPELLRQTYQLAPELERLAEDFTCVRSCYVLGRGFQLSVVRELCCKLQEGCFVNASPFSQADFLHGPMALIEPGSRVIYFHRDDATGDFSRELLQRLEAAGAQVLLFTDSPELARGRKDALLLPQSDDVLAPFAFTGASQLFACFLADKKGLDPDNSRNLSKYTLTM